MVSIRNSGLLMFSAITTITFSWITRLPATLRVIPMTDLPTDTRTVWDVLRSPRRGPHYMGMVSPIYYTADMVRALPEDGNRYEVVHGELLVTPAPRLWHEEVAARLQERVREYLRREPVGLAIGSRSDLSWGLKDVLVSPDLFVVPLAEARKDDWMALHTVLLVAEVLSPSSLKTDRFTKRRLYQEMGVSLYWIVDPTESQVEVWLPRDDFPRFEREELAWQPIGAETRFQVRLEELFRPI